MLKDVSLGLKAMHELGITHRDIKLENILYDGIVFKLCDFGSSSDQFLENFEDKKRVGEMFEDFEKNTTFMYRPPEMIDKYLKLKVDTKVDMWMLGVLIYILNFCKDPFD
jgi:serine/threonine protein kinase